MWDMGVGERNIYLCGGWAVAGVNVDKNMERGTPRMVGINPTSYTHHFSLDSRLTYVCTLVKHGTLFIRRFIFSVYTVNFLCICYTVYI
jgi:hypothetical protein